MTLLQNHPFKDAVTFTQYIAQQVHTALTEDIGTGDLTAQLVPNDARMHAVILVREDAVICGTDWVNACFTQVDKNISIEWLVREGEKVQPNQLLCKIHGLARSLLTAERCALNFLQTLSATATQTRIYVDAIHGTHARILDTRKTIPHLRLAQKYAVTVGGGCNQRLALYDGILIKENHIAAAGSIEQALQQAFALNTEKNTATSIQIEVENLLQLTAALEAGATSILLDNFDLALLQAAVTLNKSFAKPALLEASGGITLGNVRAIAETGVDRISIGAITKNIHAVDLSMRILPN